MNCDRKRLIELIDDFGDDVALCDVCSRPREDCEGCTNEQLADYLLENGVIVPPVKVGDTIYMIVEKRAKISREYFHFIKKTKLTFLNLERVLKDWGKTVFLTKEEAEKALKGGATNE